MSDYGSTDRVRRSAAMEYIEPARLRGERLVSIHSGTFGKSLVAQRVLLPNRFPIICNALKSSKFQKDNHVKLLEIQGPPSGRSSTVTFVFEVAPLSSSNSSTSVSVAEQPFQRLRGLLKKTYKTLGGAESFHNAERRSWGS